MSSGLVVLILSLLLGMQPITTDLYLPALPASPAALVPPWRRRSSR
jgi:DHA1 family bicyclomycin/chloramphenicol resistance-like MFS transporter